MDVFRRGSVLDVPGTNRGTFFEVLAGTMCLHQVWDGIRTKSMLFGDTKKGVWSGPACTDRKPSLPGNWTLLGFCISFSVVFARDRFLCTFSMPRLPKPQKYPHKGCHVCPVSGTFYQSWSHLGPQVSKMTARDPETELPSLPRKQLRRKMCSK